MSPDKNKAASPLEWVVAALFVTVVVVLRLVLTVIALAVVGGAVGVIVGAAYIVFVLLTGG